MEAIIFPYEILDIIIAYTNRYDLIIPFNAFLSKKTIKYLLSLGSLT